MKKLTLSIITTCMLFTFVPTQLKAEKQASAVSVPTTTTNELTEGNALLLRLNEIKEMDKSKLSSPEKKQLRTEVLSIKERLKKHHDGVLYISTGTVILIIILLIILL